MVSDIISKFGKIRYTYLVGPEFDIYKVYLVFEIAGCYRVELKESFSLTGKNDEEIGINEYVHILTPEDAYLELTNCDYQNVKGQQAVLKPNKETLQIVMDLLLESV